MRCIAAMNVLEILRLKHLNYSYRDIAAATNCSKSCVGNVIKKCKACELDYETAKDMPLAALHKIIYRRDGRTKSNDDIDWSSIHERLTQDNSQVNLLYIWLNEYRPNHLDGLSYSHFCRKYRDWKTSNIK